jgi:two-component system LytT family response regulator
MVAHPKPSVIVRVVDQFPELELVAEATDGVEALRCLRDRRIDVLIAEANLVGVSGFGLIDALKRGTKPLTVITTSSDVSAAEAFDRGVFDDVVESAPAGRLQLALTRAREQLERTHVTAALRSYARAATNANAGTDDDLDADRPIALVTPRRVVLVTADKIDWAEAANTRVIVCAKSKQYPVTETLADFERRLPRGRFIRVRCSVIVNVGCIQTIQSRGHGELAVMLNGGRRIDVGTTFRDDVEQLLKPHHAIGG